MLILWYLYSHLIELRGGHRTPIDQNYFNIRNIHTLSKIYKIIMAITNLRVTHHSKRYSCNKTPHTGATALEFPVNSGFRPRCEAGMIHINSGTTDRFTQQVAIQLPCHVTYKIILGISAATGVFRIFTTPPKSACSDIGGKGTNSLNPKSNTHLNP
jgi:hypothetical protein